MDILRDVGHSDLHHSHKHEHEPLEAYEEPEPSGQDEFADESFVDEADLECGNPFDHGRSEAKGRACQGIPVSICEGGGLPTSRSNTSLFNTSGPCVRASPRAVDAWEGRVDRR